MLWQQTLDSLQILNVNFYIRNAFASLIAASLASTATATRLISVNLTHSQLQLQIIALTRMSALYLSYIYL